MPYQYDLFSMPVGAQRMGTSRAAAASIAKEAGNLRERVLRAIEGLGEATADEVAGCLGLSILTVRPRVTELHKHHWVEPTEKKRRNQSGKLAVVWKKRTPTSGERPSTTTSKAEAMQVRGEK